MSLSDIRAMSDLSLECGANRTSAQQSEVRARALIAAVAATKQPGGQIFAFAVGQIRFRTPGILSPGKGRWPSSRTLGWDAVDATASCARWDRRAPLGLVSDHRTCGRAEPKRTVKSCGPDASAVGVKSAEGKSARPGADEPAIRRRRRQQSPILRGEREVSRKAIAQGMPECLR
jgi:hypothetical protein